MSGKLKVYGGLVVRDGKQRRAVVATTSQREVARITEESLSYIRNFWSVTGNVSEVRDAMENPGRLITYVDQWGRHAAASPGGSPTTD